MRYRVVTDGALSHDEIEQAVEKLVSILGSHEIASVLVMFGFAWGNEFNNWREMELSPDDILPIVEYVERRRYGSLGDDDLTLRFSRGNFYNEFLFCHESDIHWEFMNQSEQPQLFKDILDFFRTSFAGLRCQRELVRPPERTGWETVGLSELDGNA